MRPLNLSGAIFCASLFLLTGAGAPVGMTLASDESAGPQGKLVTLRIGEGFSVTKVRSLARDLEEDGCPTRVTTAGGIPDKLTVEVEGNSVKAKSVGSAESAAKKWCLASEGG